jgi:hypothetical protein
MNCLCEARKKEEPPSSPRPMTEKSRGKPNIKRKKKGGPLETDEREASKLFLVAWEIAY